uniref:uncharacterized protein LOC118519799 n=1 Tax=Halichoerus grypus TaxID=9711 RepID=UPI0016590CB6|nr:uncharacterized protein LOC118519799 [Halichoerus grypus]
MHQATFADTERADLSRRLAPHMAPGREEHGPASQASPCLSPEPLVGPQTGLRVPPMNGDVPEVFLAGGDLVPQGHTARCLSVVESREQLEEDEEEEEGKTEEGDGFHAVPLRRSGAFRAHGHNHNPFKRHSWGPGRELQDPLSRSELQAVGCTGAREAPLLQSQEELDAFLELQRLGGQPPRVGQSCCHPSAGPLDHSAPGMLSKSVSMSGISCLLGCSDPAAPALRKGCPSTCSLGT